MRENGRRSRPFSPPSRSTFEWLTPLGVQGDGYPVNVLQGEDLWIATKLDASATSVPLGRTKTAPLPAISVNPGETLALLHRVDSTGRVIEALVIGAGLNVHDLSVNGNLLRMTGFTSCGTEPILFGANGERTKLPDPCLTQDNRAAGAYVLSVEI